MRYAILLVPLIALFALACDDDGAEPSPTATESALAEPTPDAATTPEATAETLAFLRDGDIWLIDADGGNERRLNLSNAQSFSWISSDQLEVTTDEEPPRRLLVDLEGNSRELLFPAGGSWSGDGTQYVVPVGQEVLVFARDGEEVARLEVQPPPVGEGPKQIECGGTDPLVFGQPVFSPDGQSIFVAVECSLLAGVTGNLAASVFEVSLDGTVNRRTPLSVNLDAGGGPRFSPDGSHMAQLDTWDGGICVHPWYLTVADANGDNGQELTLAELGAPHGGGVVGFDWSPDGDAVVATVNAALCPDQGEGQVVAGLYILKLDGSQEEILAEEPAGAPAWSPAGKYIAYVSGEDFGEISEPPLIRLLDRTTGQSTDLATGGAPAWRPQP